MLLWNIICWYTMPICQSLSSFSLYLIIFLRQLILIMPSYFFEVSTFPALFGLFIVLWVYSSIKQKHFYTSKTDIECKNNVIYKNKYSVLLHIKVNERTPNFLFYSPGSLSSHTLGNNFSLDYYMFRPFYRFTMFHLSFSSPL